MHKAYFTRIATHGADRNELDQDNVFLSIAPALRGRPCMVIQEIRSGAPKSVTFHTGTLSGLVIGWP